MLDDYKHAPLPRQEEIARFLVSIGLDATQPDIVRQNAFVVLQRLEPLTQNPAKLALAAHMQERIGRGSLDFVQARVAHAAGTLPYLKQAQRAELFRALLGQLKKVGHGWRAFPQHGEVLRNLQEVGG